MSDLSANKTSAQIEEKKMKSGFLRNVVTAIFVLSTMVVSTLFAFTTGAETTVGYAYTLNNDGQNNSVVVLARKANGTLAEVENSPVSAGGKGLLVPAGGDFDAQGAVRISGRHLLAVNPGSNTIAVFNIEGNGKLQAVEGSPFSSGGITPLSLAISNDIVYVANQAVDFVHPSVAPNITGFRICDSGALTPITGSTIEFEPGQGPAQVDFSPKSGILAVTAGFQTDGKIHTYALQADGTLKDGPGSPYVSKGVSGTVGFSWSADGKNLLVSNFRGSAVTVFSVDAKTAAISPNGHPYPNRQGAACWTALSPDGKTLYTANFVSNSISAFSVNVDGTLTLLGSTPKRKANGNDTKDLQVSPDGKYLYVVGPIAKQIAVFEIGSNRIPKELSLSQSPFSLKSG